MSESGALGVAVSLARVRGPVLAAAVLAVVAGLLGAVALGRPEPAALAAPFAVLLAAGLAAPAPASGALRVALVPAADRYVEGDAVVAEITILGEGRLPVFDLAIDAVGPFVAPGPRRWSGPARRGARWSTTVELATASWGNAVLGPVWVRVRGPFGMLAWEGPGPSCTVQVLPEAARLQGLLASVDARTAAGVHTARRRGEGTELAELRPWQPGDHPRTVNWRASARHDQLWSTARHPDRSADLVLLLDAFADGPGGREPALDDAVRVAWSLALPHVRAHDRVGVVSMGGYLRWLPPVGGPRAPYALVDTLLKAQAERHEIERPVRLVPRVALPAGALVAAVTPLHEWRVLEALVDLRAAGHAVVAVVLDVTARLPFPTDAGARAASRLWAAERSRRVSWLADHGVRVVKAPPRAGPLTGDDLGMVLAGVGASLRATRGAS